MTALQLVTRYAKPRPITARDLLNVQVRGHELLAAFAAGKGNTYEVIGGVR